MSTYRERRNVVGGLFKVRDATVSDVVALVSQWKKDTDGGKFERLSVRDCSGKTQRDRLVAIDFCYNFGRDDTAMGTFHALFHHKYTDILRRRFGNGLAVWDISTPVYEIVD
jgi:hypothetical protein